MAEYKLSYTASEINEKLGRVDENTQNINQLSAEMESMETQLIDVKETADSVEVALAPTVVIGTCNGDTVEFSTSDMTTDATGEEIYALMQAKSVLVLVILSENISLVVTPSRLDNEIGQIIFCGYNDENQEILSITLPLNGNVGTITRTPYLKDAILLDGQTLKDTSDEDITESVKAIVSPNITGNAGDFVVIGEDGSLVAKTIASAEGVDF